ncbi:unnamed protein product [Clavelina lepadiformis]|uniref:PiggyBac transposable element-derived protein domain-containing protein n=1 Tax=Clavelina lepadiformis TaxID=159417 RepID=A0ABP0G357_CLALP
MGPASFYGRSVANFEESSDEDFSSDEEESDDSVYEPSDSSSTSVEQDEEEDTSAAVVVTTTGMVDGTSGLATLQNSWTATSVRQRNFGFTGQETLCIQAEPSHEGKVWPIDVFSLFISDDIIGLMIYRMPLRFPLKNLGDYRRFERKLSRYESCSWTKATLPRQSLSYFANIVPVAVMKTFNALDKEQTSRANLWLNLF